jgi:arylformamidase
MDNSWIDITYPVSTKLPKWPGSIGFKVTHQMQMPEQTNNLTSIEVDCHLGTHLDAPLHFVHNGKAIHEMDLNKFLGNAYVAEIYGAKSISYQHLENASIPNDCKKLLLKTDNQQYWQQGLTTFQEDFASIDLSGVQWVLERGIELIGIDYLSIQRFKDSIAVHQQLLEQEVVIVETLNLEQVNTGWYSLICLPIKLEGLEGAPVRALLKKL